LPSHQSNLNDDVPAVINTKNSFTSILRKRFISKARPSKKNLKVQIKQRTFIDERYNKLLDSTFANLAIKKGMSNKEILGIMLRDDYFLKHLCDD
jgi:hypothetical protein